VIAARIIVVPHLGHDAVVADESGVAVAASAVAWIMVSNPRGNLRWVY
jgi:hypothetical protein